MRSPVFLLILMLLPAMALAEPAGPEDSAHFNSTANEFSYLKKRYDERLKSGIPKPEQQMIPSGALDYIVDERAKKQLGAAIYEDYHWSLKHNRSAFEWQGFSTRVIFYVVILLVFVGVLFSGVQFFKGYRERGQDKTSAAEYQTELEISTKGIKVSSPVLGVIILVISLAFFYLYLVHVYPINLPD